MSSKHAADDRTVTELCRRFDLDFITLHREASDRSVLVAEVRNRNGQRLMLKQLTPEHGRTELIALQTWQATGLVPRLVAVLEPGVYLAEWLYGPSLADVRDGFPLDMEAIGRMISGLHTIAPPLELPPIRDRFALSAQDTWFLLPAAMKAVAREITVLLSTYQPPTAALLHGDLVPTNVICTPSGPRAIDPFGYSGLASWDLAQLAVAAEGRGRPGLLKALLTGYGTEPPLMAEMFAWMILYFFHKNLAAHRSEFIARLQPLAEQLSQTGDPETFLYHYRGAR